MTDGAALLEMLPPRVAGRLETLAGLPLATVGAGLDDDTATVATLTVVCAVLGDVTVEHVVDDHRTVASLRQAARHAVGDAVAEAVEAATQAVNGDEHGDG